MPRVQITVRVLPTDGHDPDPLAEELTAAIRDTVLGHEGVGAVSIVLAVIQDPLPVPHYGDSDPPRPQSPHIREATPNSRFL